MKKIKREPSRLAKRVKRGFRGYPLATVAFYGEDAARASKIVVGIKPSETQILGCPHEEGIDYPKGQVCPQCPYWAHRDRWTGEVLPEQ
jgi:hypothetical protein